jgi:hypothetical protein
VTPAGLDAVTAALAGTLDEPTPGRAGSTLEALAGIDEPLLRRAVTIQGLAVHLHRQAAADGALSPSLRRWLAEQDGLVERRLERLHEDLAALLAGAARAGIAIMPLKGALLTTGASGEPRRRPMADLDLLVRAGDRDGAGRVLLALGYRAQPRRNRRPTHDVFVDPGGDRVVSRDGEHPDNPRRVELHVEVRRHLWGWTDEDDLTDRLWASSRAGTILGQPALLPSDEALLAHLAVHAACDLLVGRGRLLQWLDLAHVAGRVGRIGALPHPRLAWVALTLARRAQPRSMAGVDLAVVRRSVPDRLVGWTSRVPLDHRCGLSRGRPPEEASSAAARWDRWGPAAWKLGVAYGDLPVPVAVVRHGITLARVATRATAQRAASRS